MNILLMNAEKKYMYNTRLRLKRRERERVSERKETKYKLLSRLV